MKKSYNTKVFNYVDGKHIELYTRSVSKEFDEKKKRNEMISEKLVNDVEIEKAFEEADQNERLEQFARSEYRTEQQEEHCLAVSQNRTKRQIIHITRSNEWDYFITLTIDRKKFDASDYDLTVKKLTKYLNNIRYKKAPNFKYLIVPELHADKKNYHFHGVIANIGRCRFEPSGHYDDDGEVIYNWLDWNYGYTTATKIKDIGRVSSYITKYITKSTAQVLKNKKRYYCSRNVERVEPDYINMPTHEFIEQFADEFDYLKTITIPGAKQKVTYCEINKKEK